MSRLEKGPPSAGLVLRDAEWGDGRRLWRMEPGLPKEYYTWPSVNGQVEAATAKGIENRMVPQQGLRDGADACDSRDVLRDVESNRRAGLSASTTLGPASAFSCEEWGNGAQSGAARSAAARLNIGRSTIGMKQRGASGGSSSDAVGTAVLHNGSATGVGRIATGPRVARPAGYVIPTWQSAPRRDDIGTSTSTVLTHPRSLTGAVDTVGTSTERAGRSGCHGSMVLHTQGVQKTLSTGASTEPTSDARTEG